MSSQHFIGNLTDAPALRSKGSQTPRATFTLAVKEGKDSSGKDKVHFVKFVAFGSFAQNLLTQTKGTRMVIEARLDSYTQEVQIDGRNVDNTVLTFIAIDGGPSLRWATSKVSRNAFSQNGNDAAPAKDEEDSEPVREEAPQAHKSLSDETDEYDEDEAPREERRSRRSRSDDGDEPRERTRRSRTRSED